MCGEGEDVDLVEEKLVSGGHNSYRWLGISAGEETGVRIQQALRLR